MTDTIVTEYNILSTIIIIMEEIEKIHIIMD
jgi:hypothetical protein